MSGLWHSYYQSHTRSATTKNWEFSSSLHTSKMLYATSTWTQQMAAKIHFLPLYTFFLYVSIKSKVHSYIPSHAEFKVLLYVRNWKGSLLGKAIFPYITKDTFNILRTFKHKSKTFFSKLFTLFLTCYCIRQLCSLCVHRSSVNVTFWEQPEILHYPLAQQHYVFSVFAEHMALPATYAK